MQTAVAAAARVLEWAIEARGEGRRALRSMLTAMLGSPEAALLWMQKMTPKLQAIVQAKALTTKGNDDDRG